jgi:hypothetical protein
MICLDRHGWHCPEGGWWFGLSAAPRSRLHVVRPGAAGLGPGALWVTRRPPQSGG